MPLSMRIVRNQGGQIRKLQDKVEKLKGVKSLIQYATMCEYMLVPTEEEELLLPAPSEAPEPDDIPGYGTRGWW